MKNPLCLIPARGGSKRIPRKNIKVFAGLPMIVHSIRVAQEADVFSRIVVSTDCPEIAAITREYRAEVPFTRPVEVSNDMAGTDAVMGHALGFSAAQGESFSTFYCLHATAPFVRAEFLRRGGEIHREKHAATAFAVTMFPYTIFRSLKLTPEGRVEMFWPENFSKCSQHLPEVYHDARQFYWSNTAKYRVERRLFSSNSVPVFIPRNLVQDIDTPEDWVVAEQMFHALRTPVDAITNKNLSLLTS